MPSDPEPEPERERLELRERAEQLLRTSEREARAQARLRALPAFAAGAPREASASRAFGVKRAAGGAAASETEAAVAVDDDLILALPETPPPPASKGPARWSADGAVIEPRGIGVTDPARSDPAERFLAERAELEGLRFQQARGYWANTYVPGDPELRLLQARLAGADRSSLEAVARRKLRLHEAATQPLQPLDPSSSAALAVFLGADRRGLTGSGRLLVQVGLRATERRSGQRPAMDVAVVLDLRGRIPVEVAAAIRAVVLALAEARDVGDRFSLVVAGRPGGIVVPAVDFRRGGVAIAMNRLLASERPPGDGLDLAEAMLTAVEAVAVPADANAPLGTSLVLLVTAGRIGEQLDAVAALAHTSAVSGVPVSIVGFGEGPRLEELDRIALAGQGNRRLLTTPAGAGAVVDRELTAAARAVARVVRLRIRLAPGVELVDVIGSRRLDEPSAEQVREAERAIDLRLARSLGIASDRGEDEEGVQIVIPAFYAGDDHVILLDVVAPGPGSIADVTVRYKDLVHLRNGVARASLSVGRDRRPPGPLQLNVLKNLLARRLSGALALAADAVAEGNVQAAVEQLRGARLLLVGLAGRLPALREDVEVAGDVCMLDEYLLVLETDAAGRAGARGLLADSLRLAGLRKAHAPYSAMREAV